MTLTIPRFSSLRHEPANPLFDGRVHAEEARESFAPKAIHDGHVGRGGIGVHGNAPVSGFTTDSTKKKRKLNPASPPPREVKGRIRLSLQEYLGFSRCVQEVRRNDRPPYLIGIGSPAGCLTVAISPLEGSETPGVTESLLQDQFTVGGASSVWLMPASCHFRDPTSRLKVQNSWNLTGLSLSPATTWPVDSSRV